MATKPPSQIKDYPPESLEKIAYASVATVPTVEPNDRNRLGFHVWRWLTSREGTLEQALRESGARLNVSHPDALVIIRDSLVKSGISL